jgi:hypothetical protein
VKAVLAAVGAAFLLAACGSVLAPPAAVVAGHKIKTKTVTAALARFRASPQFDQAVQQSGGEEVARQFEQTYLAQLIRRAVLEPRAEHLGITVTAAEVDKAVNQIKKNFPNENAFNQALKQQGLTLAQLQPLVGDRVLEQKLRRRITAGISGRSAQDRAWTRWLHSAYESAHVKVNPSYGAFDLKTQTIVNGSSSFPGAPSPTVQPSSSSSP